jgi:hypothetical protein
MPPVKVDLRAGDQMFRDASLLYPALAILLIVFAVAPLTYPASFQSHTGFNAVYNLMDLNAHLDAILGWAPTFGRGFDAMRMDGPLPFIAAESFYLLGFSSYDSIKLVYAFAFLLSGIGMFLLARRLFSSDAAGILAAIVYVYFPYHLADVYVRGALGEATEWAIFPFALFAGLHLGLFTAPARRNYVAAIVTFALAVLAQPGLGLLFGLGALAVFLMVRTRQPRAHPIGEWMIGVGLLLGGTLLLPSFLQNRAIGNSYSFTPAFVLPFQFLTASWGSDLPKGNYLEQFPFQLGIGALGLSILALALLLRRGADADSPNPARRTILLAIIGGAVLLVLMTPPASRLWEITGATFLVEYPFQLLTFAGLALSITAGSIVVNDPRFSQTPMLAALTVIPILGVYAYLTPEYLDLYPARPPVAVFNQNEIALLDAKIVRPPGILRHGATVQVDLQWQALRQVNHDYTVFVHVVDDSGKEWGGEDSKPQNGAQPTLQWTVGRVISDTHAVQIDLAGPPEGYHLEIGLYQAANGGRAVTGTGATEIRIEEN